MNKKAFLAIAGVLVLSGVAAVVVLAQGKDDLAEIKAATARFHRTEVAQEAGWDYVEGLDNCFDNPGVGGMGYHLINTSLLDDQVTLTSPEALVYAPGPQGQLQLAGVEYIVPADAWSESEPPEALGQQFHLESELGVYVLHVWLFKNNPVGTFEDWNPKVSCPAA
jgi:hypothetical protein